MRSIIAELRALLEYDGIAVAGLTLDLAAYTFALVKFILKRGIDYIIITNILILSKYKFPKDIILKRESKI